MWEFAESLARRMHALQLDKAGKPYWHHLQEVADRCTEGQPEHEIGTLEEIAWLHDIVEDTSMSLAVLQLLNFPPEVLEAIDALTKRIGEDRRSYIKRVASNRLALPVKIADIRHNLNDERKPVMWQPEDRDKYKEKLRHDLAYLTRVERG